MWKFNIRNKRKFKLIFWALFSTPFIVLLLLVLLAANGQLGYMPSFDVLENPNINLSSHIISEDGEILGPIFIQNQNRTYVKYEELPQKLIDALISTEDVRFYKHSGIDFKGLMRAVLFLGKRGGGSTLTQQLAKQLFHNPAKSKLGRLKQKIKEWVIATRLEKAYTKEEIIAMYLNQVDFLYNAVGIHSAAEIYFNTSLDSLKLQEAAVLVGMAQNPAAINPRRNEYTAERAFDRRNIVLTQMVKYGKLDGKIKDSISILPIELEFKPVSHNLGLATYFREFIKRYISASQPKSNQYFTYHDYKTDSIRYKNDPLYGWCNKNKKPDGSNYDLYTDGLKIYTTINSKMQKYAEEAISEHMKNLQEDFYKSKKGYTNAPFSKDMTRKQIKNIMHNSIMNSARGRLLRRKKISTDSIYKIFNIPVKMQVFTWEGTKDTTMTPLDSIKYYKYILRTGFMSIEPKSGHVKAYVGGIDFKYFKYDHVTQGKRQAGSTFKPFLYILAMKEGYDPCYKVPNVRVKFDDVKDGKDTVWSPRTLSDPEDLGQNMTLRWGLARSENNISAWLVKRFSPQPIANIANKMGIKSYIDPVNSIVYGPSDMSVEEMVASYATFANKGIYTEPVYVTKIEDKNGTLLASFEPRRKEAIDEKTAFLMLRLMEGVTSYGLNEGKRSYGTAASLRSKRYNIGEQVHIAGKTGTSQNNSDGWFIGIVPQLVSGGWIGGEERSINSHVLGSGSVLPVWGIYMSKIYADSTLLLQPDIDFEAPENFSIDLDCNSKNRDVDVIKFNQIK